MEFWLADLSSNMDQSGHCLQRMWSRKPHKAVQPALMDTKCIDLARVRSICQKKTEAYHSHPTWHSILMHSVSCALGTLHPSNRDPLDLDTITGFHIRMVLAKPTNTGCAPQIMIHAASTSVRWLLNKSSVRTCLCFLVCISRLKFVLVFVACSQIGYV